MKNTKAVRVFKSPVVLHFVKDIPTESEVHAKRSMLIASKMIDAIMQKDYPINSFSRRLKVKQAEFNQWLSGTHEFTPQQLEQLNRILAIEFD